MPTRRKLNRIERLAYRVLGWTDIDRKTLAREVKRFAATVPGGAKVLDAGAGLKPYAKLFGHCAYESCDFAECEDFFGNLDDGQRHAIRDRHDYVCPLDNIPVASETFDFVLCTQVLEHVPDPVAVLKELHRVLSPSGQIFVTVPQGYGIHGEPYNFFYFTKFGLELILKKAGFQAIAIQERGGYFSYLFDRLAYAIPRIVAGYGRHAFLVMLLLAPLHVVLAYALAPALLILDPLDKEKRFTLGYASLAQKDRTPSAPS